MSDDICIKKYLLTMYLQIIYFLVRIKIYRGHKRLIYINMHLHIYMYICVFVCLSITEGDKYLYNICKMINKFFFLKLSLDFNNENVPNKQKIRKKNSIIIMPGVKTFMRMVKLKRSIVFKIVCF